MNNWYLYMIHVIFLVMIVSPVWFFGKISKFLFDEAEPHDMMVHHITNTFTTQDTIAMMNADEKVLQNLNDMVNMSQNKQVKQLWEVKKAEFERHLRWKAAMRYHA